MAVSKDTDNPAHRLRQRGRHRSRLGPGQPARAPGLPHPAAVRAVACTPPGARRQLVPFRGGRRQGPPLGPGRRRHQQPLREFKGQHHGALTCVAFSPDGQSCAPPAATIGKSACGTRPPATCAIACPASHRGGHHLAAVHSPGPAGVRRQRQHLAPLDAGPTGRRLETTMDRRSGDVTSLGVSRDGKRVPVRPGQDPARAVLAGRA